MRLFVSAVASMSVLAACDAGENPPSGPSSDTSNTELSGPVADDEPAEEPSTDAPQEESLLLEVTGQVTAALTASSEPLEVGVLWLNLLEDNATVLVEAAATDAIGTTLPASFDVSLIAPPSDAMLGVTLLSWGEDGQSERPVDPGRVAFGIVVVAPEGTLESLPTTATLSDFISASDASPGQLLSSFTLVSSYSVRYVEGAEAEGIMLRDIDGVQYPLNDFTIVDLANWALGTDNAICRDRRLGEGWQAPEVTACIADNAERIAAGEAAAVVCTEACGVPAEGASEEEAQAHFYCTWGCMTQGDTRGNVENECLYAYASTQAQVDATDLLCGPVPDFAESDFRSARRLDPGEGLNLSLDEGDIRSALTAGGFSLLH